MIQRLLFLLMAIVQAFFAVRLFRNPEEAKELNDRMGTILAKLPLSCYRAIGIVCAAATLLFFYLFLHTPGN